MFDPGTVIRFTGGKFNGFQGVVAKSCDSFCSVVVDFEGKQIEVVEACAHMMPLADWLATKSETERALKGNPNLK